MGDRVCGGVRGCISKLSGQRGKSAGKIVSEAGYRAGLGRAAGVKIHIVPAGILLVPDNPVERLGRGIGYGWVEISVLVTVTGKIQHDRGGLAGALVSFTKRSELPVVAFVWDHTTQYGRLKDSGG